MTPGEFIFESHSPEWLVLSKVSFKNCTVGLMSGKS